VSIAKENKCDYGICSEGRNRNIQGVITKDQSSAARLIFGKRLQVESKDFRQQAHADLGQKRACQTKPKRICAEWFAEIIGDARAEREGQRGEENVERTGKAEECSQNGFRFWVSECDLQNKSAAQKNNV
jgi:hypothetical protein